MSKLIQKKNPQKKKKYITTTKIKIIVKMK